MFCDQTPLPLVDIPTSPPSRSLSSAASSQIFGSSSRCASFATSSFTSCFMSFKLFFSEYRLSVGQPLLHNPRASHERASIICLPNSWIAPVHIIFSLHLEILKYFRQDVWQLEGPVSAMFVQQHVSLFLVRVYRSMSVCTLIVHCCCCHDKTCHPHRMRT